LASCMVLRKASGSEFAAFGSAVLQVRRHTVWKSMYVYYQNHI